MFTWEKTGKTISAEGTTVVYTAKENPQVRIESRKRKIPHNAKPGFWWHTTYVVVVCGVDWIEQISLKRAKEYADRWMEHPDGEEGRNESQ